jgi:hypothetical protein
MRQALERGSDFGRRSRFRNFQDVVERLNVLFAHFSECY